MEVLRDCKYEDSASLFIYPLAGIYDLTEELKSMLSSSSMIPIVWSLLSWFADIYPLTSYIASE